MILNMPRNSTPCICNFVPIFMHRSIHTRRSASHNSRRQFTHLTLPFSHPIRTYPPLTPSLPSYTTPKIRCSFELPSQTHSPPSIPLRNPLKIQSCKTHHPLSMLDTSPHHSKYSPTPYSPPLSANTKCNVAPPSRLYSRAILSSALLFIVHNRSSATYSNSSLCFSYSFLPFSLPYSLRFHTQIKSSPVQSSPVKSSQVKSFSPPSFPIQSHPIQ